MTELERGRCFFVGDRELPAYRIKTIHQRLGEIIGELVQQGILDFFAGSEPGFEMLAAEAVIRYRMHYPDSGVRLFFIPPEGKALDGRPQAELHKIIALRQTANRVLDPQLYPGLSTLESRRRWMADHSAACVTYFSHLQDCNSEIIQYARRGGLRVIHLAKAVPEPNNRDKA